MARLSRFEDSFWDKDLCGTAGYDALMKRYKDGQLVLQNVEEFVLGRAKAEEEYGKSLIKLAKNFTSHNEIGTFRAALEALRQQTEVTGKLHIDANAALCNLAQRLHCLVQQNNEQKKKAVEPVKKLQVSKVDLYKKAMNCQKNYKLKHDAHSNTDMNCQAEKGKGTYAKDVEKLESKLAKAKDELIKADSQYKASVESLENTRQEWEKEMTRACQVFQQVDEERIEILRSEMWVLVNIDSQTCCNQDESNDRIRAGLEKCSVEADIALFIESNQTGKERPSLVLYESFDPSPAAGPLVPTSFPLPSQNATLGRPQLRPPVPNQGISSAGIYEDIDTVRRALSTSSSEFH